MIKRISQLAAVMLLSVAFTNTASAGCMEHEQAFAANNTTAGISVDEPEMAPAPVIDFDVMEHDLGTVVYRSRPQSIDFTFRNTGDAPLVITRTETSCTCLSIKYPRQPVMPGESGTVTVTYSPKKDLGTFNNNIKVYSNTASRLPAVIFVRGEVVR